MKKILLLNLLLFISTSLYAQVGIGTTTPDPSAQLEIKSDTKGVLIPRLTTEQIKNLPSPKEGLMVFNLTTHKPCHFDGINWLYYDNTGVFPRIGDSFAGGIVVYVDQTGLSGIVAASTNQGQAPWGCEGTDISGASGTAIGTGQANTTAIVNACSEQSIAARICNDLVLNGYSDWYLPSWDETKKMCEAQQYLAFGRKDVYWSSSQVNSSDAQFLILGNCDYNTGIGKISPLYVRAVRSFHSNTTTETPNEALNALLPAPWGAPGRVLTTNGANASWQTPDINALLPGQADNAGKVLITDGASTSWQNPAAITDLNALLPAQSGNSTKVLTTDGTSTSWQKPASRKRSISLDLGGIDVSSATNVTPPAKSTIGSNRPVIGFAKGSNHVIQTQIPIPIDWNRTTPLTVTLYYSSAATTGNYNIIVLSDFIDLNTSVTSNVLSCDNSSTPASSTSNGLMEKTYTICSDYTSSSRVLGLAVKRESTDAKDTATGFYNLLGIRIDYED